MNAQAHSLCIPLLMIAEDAIIAALKTAQVEERKEHLRTHEDAGEEEISVLWEALDSIVDLSRIEWTLKRFLDKEVSASLLKDVASRTT